MTTAYPVTRVVVKDNPPPKRPVISVGRIFPIVQNAEPEVVFSTVRIEEDDDQVEDDTETKVVKPRRGRRPAAATEVAETK